MRKLHALILLLFLLGSLQGPSSAAPTWAPPPDLRLIVALYPDSDTYQWLDPKSGALHDVIHTGAFALMNTRTARMPSDRNREPKPAAVLTLSAGSRCASPTNGVQFVSGNSEIYPGVTSAELLQRRTLAIPGSQTEITPEWASILNANTRVGYDVSCGNLASSLTATGVSVRTDGNAWSNLFAANSQGEAVVERLESLPASGRWMWVGEISDESREIDLSLLMKAARDRNALLLLISPFPSDFAYASEDRLTPIALWGQGVSAGLLYSHSTRTAGLIANTDVAPTIASWFGARLRGQVSGRTNALVPVMSIDGPAQVARINRNAVSQRAAMKVLPYFALGLGLWLILPFVSKRRTEPMREVLAALPAGAMLGLLLTTTPGATAIALPASVAIAGILAWRFGGAKTILVISAATIALIIVDTAAGNPLMRSAVLGYSAIEGARYYGIGNEGMGVFLGATLILADRLWRVSSRGRIAAGMLMLFAVVVLGKFGAKAGGIAVSLGMFGVYAYSAMGGRWNAARISLVPLLAIGGLLVFAAADTMMSRGSQAHLGVEMERIAHSGIPEAMSVIGRKLAVELRLMWHSAWAIPLWLAIAILVHDRRTVSISVPSEAETPPHPTASFSLALVAGTCLTLSLNDAGVVAAALMLTMARGWTLCRLGLTYKRPAQ